MSNINTEGLPPEMQARIADIIEKAKSNAIQPVGQQAPVRLLHLLDYKTLLRWHHVHLH